MNAIQPQDVLQKLFEREGFSALDQSALVKAYDSAAALTKLFAPLRSQSPQALQSSPVIAAIPPQGLVIDRPGKYVLASDVVWAPGSDPGSAITIIASNVVLDLGGYTLRAELADRSQLSAGISIQNDVANIVVENGTLENMGYCGVRAEQVSSLAIKNITVDGLSFHNLDTRFMTPAGFHVSNAADVAILNCAVHNLEVTADSCAGIQILNTLGASVSQCLMRNFVNHDGAVQGYSYLKCISVVTWECSATNFLSRFNGNILTGGHTVIGFVPIFCIGLNFDRCSATNLTGSADDCHGISVFLDADVVVSHFVARNIIDGVTPSQTGAKSTGIEIYGVGVTVSDCVAENITAIRPQDLQAAGFSAWGLDIRFAACMATNVLAMDAHGVTAPEYGQGVGYGWAPDPREIFCKVGAVQVSYDNCLAINCQVGFDSWNHIDSSWNQVSCRNCLIDILEEPDGYRTLRGNPASECNPPITVTLANQAKGNVFPSTVQQEKGNGTA